MWKLKSVIPLWISLKLVFNHILYRTELLISVKCLFNQMVSLWSSSATLMDWKSNSNTAYWITKDNSLSVLYDDRSSSHSACSVFVLQKQPYRTRAINCYPSVKKDPCYLEWTSKDINKTLMYPSSLSITTALSDNKNNGEAPWYVRAAYRMSVWEAHHSFAGSIQPWPESTLIFCKY